MQVHIAFAAPTFVWRKTLQVTAPCTVAQAIELSGFAHEFPEFTDHFPAVGIYGERCDMQRLLQPEDRVELYRPLVFDPKETRRRRAGKKVPR